MNKINLYSDTQTQPTQAMRQAMANAPVGDEQRGEDPSVNALCERVAELLGQEAAVFLPSGTMCNELAIRVHCQAGDEVITDKTSHIINFEGGGPAALSGVMLAGVDGQAGVFSAAQARAAIRGPDRYSPRSRLISIEQTANLGGGTVWPVATVRELAALARDNGLALHMDGARLLNAAVASGLPPQEYAKHCDTVWIDLSKGLGCPVGGVLAASRELIDDVWFWKQRLGGAMRQAGILAAAGLYALDHHIDRLAEDHENARKFAVGIEQFADIELSIASVHTNIVYFSINRLGLDAPTFCARAAEKGLVLGALSPTSVRAVTHLDVARADIEAAIEIVGELSRGEG